MPKVDADSKQRMPHVWVGVTTLSCVFEPLYITDMISVMELAVQHAKASLEDQW